MENEDVGAARRSANLLGLVYSLKADDSKEATLFVQSIF